MPKPLLWIGAIFAGVGTLMLGGAYWAWSYNQAFVTEGLATTGKVIDLQYSTDSDGDGSYRPVVEFHDRDGVRRVYYSNTGSNPPAYKRGEEVTLYYMPDEPERAMIDGFLDRYMLPLILGAFALVFGGVGYGILIARWRRRQTVSELRESGLPIEAEFLESYRDTSTTVNGRSPWRVTCQAVHPGTGQMNSFTSDPLWVDLGAILQGKRLRVLVDAHDPERYWVDLDEYVPEDERAS